MEKQNQISTYTEYDRYPKVFNELKKHINPKNILSFGCSDGSEIRTLREKYFLESYIDGIDIDKELIKKNKELIKKNNDKYINYYDDINNLKKYDLILCMSVLCVWPENAGSYSFELFNKTINDLDKHLNINGYICIYNSKYILEECDISHKYKKVKTDHKYSGFVNKYNKKNNKIVNYEYFLFQKMS